MFRYEEIKSPEYYQENVLLPHSDHIAYRNATEEKLGKSSLRKSLNGLWKFHYARRIEDSIPNFESSEYSCKDWEDIVVPAHIQLEGYDAPQYANVQYPWEGHESIRPGEIPRHFNPVASYVKYFILPKEWGNQPVRISFQGVENAFALYCNGAYIGYHSDSFTPAEFSLEGFLKEGENKLAVQVYKWSAASWCEDQDFFRFSGIFREVYLYTLPKLHFKDLHLRTEMSRDFKEGKLYFSGKIEGWEKETEKETEKKTEKEEGKGILRYSLFDGGVCLPKGRGFAVEQKIISKGEIPVSGGMSVSEEKNALDCKTKLSQKAGEEFTKIHQEFPYSTEEFSISLEAPKLWSAEQPNLYTLVLELCTEEGEVLEYIVEKAGFRHFALEDGLMKINGKRIVFKGVNRHDFSSLTGRAVSVSEMEKDIQTMKRNNINALRTSHYPNNSALYRLADEYGLYVMDECNMETHGSWDTYAFTKDIDYVLPKDKKEWESMLLQRIENMWQRDKNHPSILIFSCGNESFGGSVIHEMAKRLRSLDSSRLVHYEGLFNDRSYPDSSDMESRMYPPVTEIKDYLSKHREKPFLLCEYAHSMGNSLGALYKYTEYAEEEPLFQGGFIWDYVDQSLWKKNRYGEKFLAYGGDFSDRPSDFQFSANGIVFGGDRNPKPQMQEVKYLYQNIFCTLEEEEILIKNRSLFQSTSELDCKLSLYRYGKLWKECLLETNVPPQSEGRIPNPFLKEELEGEYTLRISFHLKKDSLYGEKGFEMAFSERTYTVEKKETLRVYLLGEEQQEEHRVRSWEKLLEEWGSASEVIPEDFQILSSPHNVGVRGSSFEAIFSLIQGGLVSYRYGGKEYLEAMPRPNFWRAPTDNDTGNLMAFRYAQWKTASQYLSTRSPEASLMLEKPQEVLMKMEKDCFLIRYSYHLPTNPRSSCQMQYSVFPDGKISVSLDYSLPKEGDSLLLKQLSELPEFGTLFTLNADLENFSWYGLGEEDCYADRKHGGKLGIYHGKVRDNFVPYVFPQESGNKAEVRLATLTDEKGRGLVFLAENEEGQMNVSALPWTPHEIENASHGYELPPIHHSILRLSKAQMGVGGDDSWGSHTHEEFLVKVKDRIHFSFSFMGIC